MGIAMLGSVLFLLLIAILVGVLPVWPHSKQWGFFPLEAVGVLLLVVVFLSLNGWL
jgi:hypothetical protein